MTVFYVSGFFLNKKSWKFSSYVLLGFRDIIIEFKSCGELVYTILQGFEYII